MEEIGRHIQRTLRFKGISNATAAGFIGLSESAFEKLLTKEDILVSRLLKLSQCAQENFLEYFYDKEPIQKFRLEEQRIIQEKFEILQEKLKLKDQIIEEKERTIILQQKLIEELEKKRR